MILKSDSIAEELKATENAKDPLVIVPEPDLEALKASGAAAVDLRLGTWLRSLRGSNIACLDIFDTGLDEGSREAFTKQHYVPFGKDFILHPSAFVLGTTLEWIRLPSKLAGYVIGKSKWGRRGLVIATATGVHPGFTGCLTLEITNLGSVPIKIRPGMLICQLFLHRVDTTSESIDRSKLSGNRKPVLGDVRPDPTAICLSSIHK